MRRPLRDFAIRLVIIAAILLTLGRVYASAVVTPMLPAMAWVIEAVDDRFRVEQMGIANRKADTFIELNGAITHRRNDAKCLTPDCSRVFPATCDETQQTQTCQQHGVAFWLGNR